MKKRFFYVYIVTNFYKTVLYVGMTNNLMRRLNEHESSAIPGFSCRYRCKYLVHYEKYGDVLIAISREKEIKKWRKAKKRALVEHRNPGWVFLNKSIYRAGEDVL